MSHPVKRLLAIALAIVCLSMSVALAASETIMGTVQQVDQEKGTLTVQTEDNKTRALQVPAEMLQGIKAGSTVEVDLEDGKVVAVYRAE